MVPSARDVVKLAQDDQAGGLLAQAIEHERTGRSEEAERGFARAAAAAEATGDTRLQTQALRRLAVRLHFRNDVVQARALAERSLAIARAAADREGAAEALNTLANFALDAGDLDGAGEGYTAALDLVTDLPHLQAHFGQNLGIVAHVRGQLDVALRHYQFSLDAWTRTGNQRGRALVGINLGILRVRQQRFQEAGTHYEQSLDLAERLGDLGLVALCRLNRAELRLADGRGDAALEDAEFALSVFQDTADFRAQADALRVAGLVHAAGGRRDLAEQLFTRALKVARAAHDLLNEAECSLALGRLLGAQDRNVEALTLLQAASRLFGRLDASLELVDVAARVAALEGTYLALVRDWGQSIESADSYTHGHCERVGAYAQAVAGALGLPENEITTIRLGAYLHDVGKVHVSPEILNKQGRLTDEELRVMQQHPAWGVKMLEGIEFPWDIKPIIRWHHEKYDGTGYPDRLAGDAIPLAAQIVGIVDVYDALTSTRSYRAALTHQDAVGVMQETRHWWRADIFAAFVDSVDVGSVVVE